MSFLNRKASPKDDTERLLEIMKKNRDRVTVSKNGVIRVNLHNEDVMKNIRKKFEKLKALEV